MPEPVGVRKLHPPPDAGHRTHNLSVDEVADPSHAEQERRRNHQDVRQVVHRHPPPPGIGPGDQRATRHEPMRRHPAEPERGDELRVVPVEEPLVESHLDSASAGEDADRQEQAQGPHRARRQVQPLPAAPQKQVQVEKPKRKPQPVPPEVGSSDVQQHGVNPMDEAP